MADWTILEPTDLEIVQAAFDQVLALTGISRESADARDLARYLFDRYADGTENVQDLVRQTLRARLAW